MLIDSSVLFFFQGFICICHRVWPLQAPVCLISKNKTGRCPGLQCPDQGAPAGWKPCYVYCCSGGGGEIWPHAKILLNGGLKLIAIDFSCDRLAHTVLKIASENISAPWTALLKAPNTKSKLTEPANYCPVRKTFYRELISTLDFRNSSINLTSGVYYMYPCLFCCSSSYRRFALFGFICGE